MAVVVERNGKISKGAELLSPAGGRDQLEAAVRFGADAVYLAHEKFNMRAGAQNFDDKGLCLAVEYAHNSGVKVYITLNTVPHNDEIKEIPQVIETAADAGVDAFIVSDAGVFALCRKYAEDIDIHISVQAGIVNSESAKMWHSLGATRAVLSRELTLDEITAIRSEIPDDMELEAFVHGAMCISRSGRCLLSDYMTGRDANRGDCAQSCRWRYALCEEKRPGVYYPIEEDESGSYILNANDLNMAAYIDKMSQAGIYSFKIEGRAKSAYYTAVTTYAYRAAIDEYLNSAGEYRPQPWVLDELHKISHRTYSTGFYFGRPAGEQTYDNGGYVRTHQVVGIAGEYSGELLKVSQRNRFYRGDVLDCLEPGKEPYNVTVEKIINLSGEEIECANKAAEDVFIKCGGDVGCGAYMRKRLD
ncbi:MAG TPA: U32 family peptidase [Firmicutes bacterium]|nr:U32 family peptidase [Bacillota bacterium]